EETLGDSGAVDGDQWSRRPARAGVDRAGQEPLPGTTLPREEYRSIDGCGASAEVQDLAGGLTLAEYHLEVAHLVLLLRGWVRIMGGWRGRWNGGMGNSVQRGGVSRAERLDCPPNPNICSSGANPYSGKISGWLAKRPQGTGLATKEPLA